MNDTRRPSMGKTIPLGGKPLTFENVELAGLSDEERELQETQAALNQRREEIAQKKLQAAEDNKNRLGLEMDKAKEAAANFRKEARESPSESEKRQLYEWATEADLEVKRLQDELGITPTGAEGPAADNRTFFERNRWLMALLQVSGVLIAILYFHGQFESFRGYIEELNHGLAPEKQLQPYDVTSFQKLFFEKMVVFIDLPIALLLLFAITPFIGFYVLPFLKSKKDFYTEFFEDLTAWQRSLLTTIFVLGLLFFLALSHNVKP